MRKLSLLSCTVIVFMSLPFFSFNSEALAGQQPTISLSVNNSTGVASGSASDPDRPGQSINIHFYLNDQYPSGTFIGSTWSNGGSGVYSWQLPTSYQNINTYTLYAYAIDSTDGHGLASTSFHWNNLPTGSLTVSDSSGLASGSVSDADRPGQSINVHFYINGPYPSGTYIGSAWSNGGSGSYSWQLPTTYYDGVTRTLYAHAIDPDGPNPVIGSDSFNWAPPDPCDDVSPYQGETDGYSFTINRITGGGHQAAIEETVMCSRDTSNGTVSGNSATIHINNFESINPHDTIVDFTKWNWSVVGVLDCTSMVCSGYQDNQISISVTADSPTTLKFTWNFDKDQMCVNDWASVEFKGVNVCP